MLTNKEKSKKENKGFTLVELIVVIVILAILIGVTIGGIYQYVNKARINTDIQNCEQLQDSLYANWFQKDELVLHLTDKANVYPKVITALGIPYYYISKSGYNEKTNWQNFYECSFVMNDIMNTDGTFLQLGSFNYKHHLIEKQDFQGIISYSYQEDDTFKNDGNKNVNSLPVKVKSGNSMFVAIKIDEYGTPSIHVGICATDTSVQTIANYYWSDKFKPYGEGNKSKIIYDGISWRD